MEQGHSMLIELTETEFRDLMGEAVAGRRQEVTERRSKPPRQQESGFLYEAHIENAMLQFHRATEAGAPLAADEFLDLSVFFAPTFHNDLPLRYMRMRFQLMALVCRFMILYLRKLREIICTEHGSAITKAGGASGKGVATAIAAWIVQECGFQGPMALALATMILCICGSALHGAICEMTENEAAEALRQQLPK